MNQPLPTKRLVSALRVMKDADLLVKLSLKYYATRNNTKAK